MNRISAITRDATRVINVQATEGSHRDNAQCDPEIFKAYLTQKMNTAVKELSSGEQQFNNFIAELIEEELDKERKKKKKSNASKNSLMGTVKTACLAELNELIELGYLPDQDIESNTKKAKAELTKSMIDSADSGNHSFNSDLLKQRLFEHHSAYCELNSILEELNETLSSVLRSSTLQTQDTH